MLCCSTIIRTSISWVLHHLVLGVLNPAAAPGCKTHLAPKIITDSQSGLGWEGPSDSSSPTPAMDRDIFL